MSYLRMLLNDQPPVNAGLADSFGGDDAIVDAMHVLNLAGVRILRDGSKNQIGVWEDLDGPEIRRALRTVGMSDLTVVKLGPDVPMRYRVRASVERTAGESFAHWRKRAEEVPHR